MIDVSPTTELEAAKRLSRDLANAAITLSDAEARFLVDAYYAMQEDRKRSYNQERALSASGEPHQIISWLASNSELLEGQIKRALGRYSDTKPAGVWAKSICGIGPIITAGLLAHVDIAKAPTVGHVWRFAGLDPTVVWGKGKKRPWNAALKTLCWKIGESFVKVQNLEADYYGKVYAARKLAEWQSNTAGVFSSQAAHALAHKSFGDDTQAVRWLRGDYSGIVLEADRIVPIASSEDRPGVQMLPPAHIHARAKRYAVKLFLSHFHHVLYESTYGTPPPKPYVISQCGHAHFLAPPNWPPKGLSFSPIPGGMPPYASPDSPSQ